MKYYIYETTNIVNGKYYRGQHKTRNLNDGYLGSGAYFTRALNKYGRENFKIEILEECDNQKSLNEAEARWITQKEVDDKNCYNLKLGGTGGWDYVNKNHTSRHEAGKIGGKVSWQKRPEGVYQNFHSESSRKKAKESRIKSNGGKYNISGNARLITPSAIQKRQKTNRERKFQQGMRNSQYGTFWITNGNINQKWSVKKGKIPLGYYKGRKFHK